MTTITIGRYTASYEDGEWRSENIKLAQVLNDLREQRLDYQYEPDDAYAQAQKAVRIYGATIVEYETPETVPGRVY